MNADEYQAAIDQLGLTHEVAARALGIDEPTSNRYAIGEIPVSKAAADRLRYLTDGRKALKAIGTFR